MHLCIVCGKGFSLHCCSSWICLFSFVYLTSLVWQHTDTKLYVSSCVYSVDEATHTFHELHAQLEFLQRTLGVCPHKHAFRLGLLPTSDDISRKESTLSFSFQHSLGMCWSQTNNELNEWKSTAFVVPRSDICVWYFSQLARIETFSFCDIIIPPKTS